MIRSACNRIGTALALSLAAFAIGGCQDSPTFPAALDEEGDTSGMLEPDPNTSEPMRVVSSSNGGAGSTSAPDVSEVGATPVGIAGSASVDASAGTGGAGGTAASGPSETPVDGCWQLPAVTRARLLAVPGRGQALVGGKVMGSNRSAMNDFVDLGAIASPPGADGWVELTFANSTPYRYVKYYGAAGSHGALAELELYSGQTRLNGDAFGTAATLGAGHTFDLAIDGDATTYFESAQANDGYVGLDLAQGHIAAAPSISPPGGDFRTAPTVTLQAETGASIFYTLDGTDPAINGLPYTGPLALPATTTLLRTVARRDCVLPSETAQSVFRLPDVSIDPTRPRPIQSSIHIGNSLTDTIVDYLEDVAQSGGVQLDFNRYTIPGAGTWLYDSNPTGGFGVADVQQALRTRSFDHLSMQPFPNEPCQISPSTSGEDPGPDSDSGYIDEAWRDALSQNPNVQLWVYQQWPDPLDFTNCITGGGYTRGGWDPPTPADWNGAVQNELSYDEQLVDVLMALEPNAPRPYIVPGGLGLVRLRQAIEAGRLPGYTDFFGQIFLANGTDIHLTRPGAYFITLIFYASMFQSNPVNTTPDPSIGLTDQQALVLQNIAWETVTNYAESGVTR
jgi:hypothetical protein